MPQNHPPMLPTSKRIFFFLFYSLLYFLNKQTCTIKEELGEREMDEEEVEIFGNSSWKSHF